jgi:putative ABC transport system substrate-binding protein
MSKIFRSVLGVFIIIYGAICLGGGEVAPKVLKIRILQSIAHPALDSTVRGIADEAEALKQSHGLSLDIKSQIAQGSVSLAQQIADRFASDNPDVFVGVGTLASQAFIKHAKLGRKLLFASVTDPETAGLNAPNIYGVSNFVALDPQLKLFQSIVPNLKRLGILYNPGEPNSVVIVSRLDEICKRFGVTLVRATAANSSEIAQSARELASKSDAIFISNDNTALAAMPTIIRSVGNKPVFSSDVDNVDGKSGVLAALGPNQYEIGRQTVRMIFKIFKDTRLNQKIEYPSNTELYIDLDAANRLKLRIDSSLLKSAEKVFNSGN